MNPLALILFTLAAATTSVYAQNPSWPTILLFTRTAGFRHASIPAAISTITRLGNGSLVLDDSHVDSSVKSGRWNTQNSEDASLFNDLSSLQQFDAIVFAFTTDVDPPGTGSLLNDAQTANLLQYIEKGGSFAGIHSATNCLYHYPAYGRLAGAFFTYHAQGQNVTLKPTTRDHPSVSKLPDTFQLKEEMYHLRSDPRKLPSQAHVLVSNATAYPDPGGRHDEGTPQPLAWWRQGGLLDSGVSALGGDLDGQTSYSGGGGKAFVTTLGHEIGTWSNAAFQGHVQGGLGWLLSVSISGDASSSSNASSGDASSTPSSSSSTSNQTRSVPTSAGSRTGAAITLVALVATAAMLLAL